MRQLPPLLPVLLPVRVLVGLDLHLVHLVSDHLRPPEELHDGAGLESLPPLPVLLQLLWGKVVSLLDEWVVGKDSVHLRGVAVVRVRLAFPEELVEHFVVLAGAAGRGRRRGRERGGGGDGREEGGVGGDWDGEGEEGREIGEEGGHGYFAFKRALLPRPQGTVGLYQR